jgi:serine/threonine protein kinase
MPRYGCNLDHYFDKVGQKLSKGSVLYLAQNLLSLLEQLHSSGFVYNDLKPDNIMFGFKSKLPLDSSSTLSNVSVHLIDFGFATRYLDKNTGEHLKKSERPTFRGNIMFGSPNQMEFVTTSRRDDLISLLYLLVFLINGGNLLDVDLSNDIDRNQAFLEMKKLKLKSSILELCKDQAECL